VDLGLDIGVPKEYAVSLYRCTRLARCSVSTAECSPLFVVSFVGHWR